MIMPPPSNIIMVNELTDYTYNGICERSMGKLLEYICPMYTAHTFGPPGVVQYSHDYSFDVLKIEQKITGHAKVPVEVSRDNERQKPSGLMLSEADYVLYLMYGLEDGKPMGKLRAYLLKDIKAAIRNKLVEGSDFHQKGKNSNENALVYYLPFRNTRGGFVDHWLGNVQAFYDDQHNLRYDLNTWHDGGAGAARKLQRMVETKQQDINDEQI